MAKYTYFIRNIDTKEEEIINSPDAGKKRLSKLEIETKEIREKNRKHILNMYLLGRRANDGTEQFFTFHNARPHLDGSSLQDCNLMIS